MPARCNMHKVRRLMSGFVFIELLDTYDMRKMSGEFDKPNILLSLYRTMRRPGGMPVLCFRYACWPFTVLLV